MGKLTKIQGPDMIKNILYPPNVKNFGKLAHQQNLQNIKNIDNINKDNKRFEQLNLNNKNILLKNSLSAKISFSILILERCYSKDNFLCKTKSFINQIDKVSKDVIIKTGTCYLHKNYGKIPQYLNNFKIQAEVRKHERIKKQEEATFPEGTRLVEEHEKNIMINNLISSQNEILSKLERLPISNRSVTILKNRQNLEKKLLDLDKDLKYMQREKVFIEK